MGRRSLTGGVLAGVLLAAALPALPSGTASAQPATAPSYPSGSASAWFTGAAFDICEAPSTSAMTAWRSSYGAVGVYVGGRNRACKTQSNLSTSWMTAVHQQGWKVVPIYVGLQPPCADNLNTTKMSRSQAAARDQGAIEAADAVGQAGLYGLRPGSAIYNDIENYSTTDSVCRLAVLQYLSGWTIELHRHGFVSGVYVNLSSGAQDLAAFYSSTGLARPDAIWVARYDGVASLAFAGVATAKWHVHQRAKQYLADVVETHGGVTMRVDQNYWDAPVATVALPYTVTAGAGLNARTGPSTGYPVVTGYPNGGAVSVLCQTVGMKVGTTVVWDRLTDGSYVADYYVSTPSQSGYSPPLPRCLHPYQVTAAPSLLKRTTPSINAASPGAIDDGGLAWAYCQTTGSRVGSTVIWDRLYDGTFVTDWFVTTGSHRTFTRPLHRC